MSTVDIVFCGIPLSCECEGYPATGDGHNEPYNPATFDVVEIRSLTGDDLEMWFTERALAAITQLVLEKIE